MISSILWFSWISASFTRKQVQKGLGLGVDGEFGGSVDGLNLSLGAQVLHDSAGNGAVDLVVLDERVHGDHLHFLGDLLGDLVMSVLVKEDHVVLLLPHFSLGPLLFALALAGALGGEQFGGLGFLNFRRHVFSWLTRVAVSGSEIASQRAGDVP